MKTYKLNYVIFFCLITFILFASKSSYTQPDFMPADPNPIDFIQPDHVKFRGYIKGGPWQSWHETLKGYTIAKNTAGLWLYVHKVQNDEYVLTGIRAENTLPENLKKNIPKHLKKTAFKPSFVDESFLNKIAPSCADSSGTFRVAALLIDFPDMSNSYNSNDFDSIFNYLDYVHPSASGDAEENCHSFRHYYLEQSYGKCNIITDIIVSETGDWFKADTSHDDYGYVDNARPNADRVREMIRAAIDSAEAMGIDWSVYDNDSDGNVDALQVIHAGSGAEEGDLTNIWSHRWSLGQSYGRHYDGVNINDYTIQPEIQSDSIVAIGVIVHEFGHALGLPDLYDTDGSSAGIGNWGLMAGGSWGADGLSAYCPASFSAWSKIELNWIEPINIDNSNIPNTQVRLEDIQNNEEHVYKVEHGADDDEYFLLEYRPGLDYDLYNYCGGGLLVWHIDESRKAQDNTDNSEEGNYLVALEQADASNDLEFNYNRGDCGDPYPGSSLKSSFHDTSEPSCYSNGWGEDSDVCSVKIKGIAISADSSEVSFSLSALGNDKPIATGDSFVMNEDDDHVLVLSAADADNDALSYSVHAGPDHGSLALSSDTATYTPNPDYYGIDSFSFTVTDGSLSDRATIIITINSVNDAPEAADSIYDDISAASIYEGMLSASDVDGDTLIYSIVDSAYFGAIEITNDTTGSFTYEPNEDYQGADTLVFAVSDGSLSDTGTVSFNVTGAVGIDPGRDFYDE